MITIMLLFACASEKDNILKTLHEYHAVHGFDDSSVKSVSTLYEKKRKPSSSMQGKVKATSKSPWITSIHFY